MNDFIGVFDSGLGGITVLADLHRLLPQENLSYFGDSGNAPYGEKTQAEITNLSRTIIQRFVEQGAKAIVVACNTATSAAVEQLRQEFDLPIIGMEPALKPAIERTTGSILVLATTYTIEHDKYRNLQDRLGQHDRVQALAAPQLVRFVEQGIYHGPVITDYLAELIPNPDEIEAVVLGCTHFLYLKPTLRAYFGRPIQLFDGNAGTIQHLKRQIELASNPVGHVTIANSLSQEMVERSECMMNIYLNQLID